MQAREESKVNMSRAVEKLMDDNKAIVETVPALNNSVKALRSKISEILITAQQEDLVTKGITKDKSELKKNLSAIGTDIAAPIFAYASVAQNNTLKESVNFSFSTLLATKDDQLAPRLQNIHDAGVNNLAELAPYGITKPLLQTFQLQINEYQQIVPNPKNASAIKKTVRQNIKRLLKEADTILKEQIDKTIVILKPKYPDFVETYKNNRVIIDPSKKGTVLKGIVIEGLGKAPIAKAKITVDNTSFTTETDDKGAFRFPEIPFGEYTLSITANGFEPVKDYPVKVKRGQINKLKIGLPKTK